MGNNWYSIVKSNEPLFQGDFIDSCMIILPVLGQETEEITTKAIKYNVIIMSQSCDLVQEKVDMVLVCPYWSLKDLGKENSKYNTKKWKNDLRRGFIQGYHLLNKCELDDYQKEYLVIDFRNLFGVPFEYINSLAKSCATRLRLESPYKEHLSQAFARFIMRVGLPEDIPTF